MVVLSVCAILLFGSVTFAVREQPVAIASGSPLPSASPVVAVAPFPTAKPSAAPGTYLVGDGESIFSVAEATGIDANLLIYWNAAAYPSLSLTPALTAGWVLQLAGPMPATPTPEPSTPPRTYSPYPIPSLPPVAGLPSIPTIDRTMFSGPTQVQTYEINGITPSELTRSIATNGPPDAWTGGHAEATTRVHVSVSVPGAHVGRDLRDRAGQPNAGVTFVHGHDPPLGAAAGRDRDNPPVVDRRADHDSWFTRTTTSRSGSRTRRPSTMPCSTERARVSRRTWRQLHGKGTPTTASSTSTSTAPPRGSGSRTASRRTEPAATASGGLDVSGPLASASIYSHPVRQIRSSCVHRPGGRDRQLGHSLRALAKSAIGWPISRQCEQIHATPALSAYRWPESGGMPRTYL